MNVDYEKSIRRAAVGTIIIAIVVAVVEIMLFLIAFIRR